MPGVTLAALAVYVAILPGAAAADENGHSPWPALRAAVGGEGGAKGATSVFQTRNGGVLQGEVVAVDRRAGTLSIRTQNRGLVDVIVLPSTNIHDSKNAFHTIADIARGARIEVFVSQKGQLFIAQIIHLR